MTGECAGVLKLLSETFKRAAMFGPLDPLPEDKLIQFDGDDQRFGRGLAVRLAW